MGLEFSIFLFRHYFLGRLHLRGALGTEFIFCEEDFRIVVFSRGREVFIGIFSGGFNFEWGGFLLHNFSTRRISLFSPFSFSGRWGCFFSQKNKK